MSERPTSAPLPPVPAGEGRFATNVVNFARVLRRAGIPVGPGKVLDAIEAVRAVGIRRRDDLYWALSASLLSRPDQRELFEQAFQMFFRNPRIMERLLSVVLPEVRLPAREQPRAVPARRLSEALSANVPPGAETVQPRLELEAALCASDRERLQQRDFEQMSREELAQARALLRELPACLAPRATRRYRPAARGRRIDLRRSLRQALRNGGELTDLLRSEPLRRPPPLVLICDISGSMGRYSRLFLHFAHALAGAHGRISTFLFATRLSNVTRQLRERDVDRAVDAVSAAVEDWSGGTRIGDCIRQFNLHWSRRVLAQGAVVLLLSDGLERESEVDLAAEMERLHKSCARLVWLNPLLRYAGFEPRAQGVRSILPHVDELRTVHNLRSLRELARALAAGSSRPPAAHAPAVAQAWLRQQTPGI